MKTARMFAVAAALLVAAGAILTAAPASAKLAGNGWNNGLWTNSRSNGTSPGQSTDDHALRVIGFELPSDQVAK